MFFSIFKNINFYAAIVIIVMIVACSTTKKADSQKSAQKEQDTIAITNDSLEYEVIIIEVGFNSWLATQPQRGHYSQSFLENKNRYFVANYNARAMSSINNRNLYPQRIDYDPMIDYGYEVNYLLYNYFLFFQQKYNQNLR